MSPAMSRQRWYVQTKFHCLVPLPEAVAIIMRIRRWECTVLLTCITEALSSTSIPSIVWEVELISNFWPPYLDRCNYSDTKSWYKTHLRNVRLLLLDVSAMKWFRYASDSIWKIWFRHPMGGLSRCTGRHLLQAIRLCHINVMNACTMFVLDMFWAGSPVSFRRTYYISGGQSQHIIYLSTVKLTAAPSTTSSVLCRILAISSS